MNTLAEVAAMWRLDEQMKEPVRYLHRQIAVGKFRARKIGRHWMMTADDVEYNLDQLANTSRSRVAEPEPGSVSAMPSVASMRRRRAAC